MTDGDYRDELAAAHARIAELEEELADARKGGVNAKPWLRELELQRASVVAEWENSIGNPKRRWKIRGIIAATAFVLASALSLILWSWVPFLPIGLLTLHPTMLVLWSMGRARQQKTTAELAKIDEKVADVKRMASMMGAARVRVDGGSRSAVSGGAPDEVEIGVTDAGDPRAARRG